MNEPPLNQSNAMVLLRRAEHVLFAALLVLGSVRAAAGAYPAVAITVAAAVAGWYGLGLIPRRRALAQRGVAAGWLAGLVAGWLALVTVSVDYVWLAFVLYLLAMQLLARTLALAVVVLLVAATITAVVVHNRQLDAAMVLGPMIGAMIVVVITDVYRGLRQEAQLRERLLTELTAAQDQLAAAERHAGTMAERERLAREIHDTVAQSLSSIILLLRAAAASWPDAPPSTRDRLITVTETAQFALEDTRRLVRALTPAQLSGQPLWQALHRLCDGTRTLGLDARFTVDGQEYPLPTPTEVTLLRAGQEALANARTHAGASQVAVTLTYLSDSVNLDVVDDGRGFDVEHTASSATAGTGLGLDAMRARLAEVGGRLTIESSPGQGTAVSVSIPVGDP